MNSTSTAPVSPSPDSYTVQDWIHILQNAAQTPQDHPRYAEAQQVSKLALSRIQTMNNLANTQDVQGAPGQIGPWSAAGMGALQGATSGFGDELAGGVMGGSPGIDAARQTIGAAEEQHPLASLAGNVAGSFANPVLRLLTEATGGVESPMLRGALVGGAGGALQGLGRGQGGLQERLPGAELGGAVGAVTGGFTNKVLDKLKVGQALNAITKKTLEMFRSGAPAEAEAVIGGKISATPEALAHPDVQAAIRDYNAGKISGQDLRTAMDFAAGRTPESPQLRLGAGGATTQIPATAPVVKGGGTATPGYGGNPKGIDVTGPRPNPPVPTAPTITEIQDRLSGIVNAKPSPDMSMSQRITAALRVAGNHVGKELSPDERELVIKQVLEGQPKVGQSAIPGKPQLGTFESPGPFQEAGSNVRTVSPPQGKLPLTAQGLQAQIGLARNLGMSEEQIALRLATMGVTPQQVEAALVGQ